MQFNYHIFCREIVKWCEPMPEQNKSSMHKSCRKELLIEILVVPLQIQMMQQRAYLGSGDGVTEAGGPSSQSFVRPELPFTSLSEPFEESLLCMRW